MGRRPAHCALPSVMLGFHAWPTCKPRTLSTCQSMLGLSRCLSRGPVQDPRADSLQPTRSTPPNARGERAGGRAPPTKGGRGGAPSPCAGLQVAPLKSGSAELPNIRSGPSSIRARRLSAARARLISPRTRAKVDARCAAWVPDARLQGRRRLCPPPWRAPVIRRRGGARRNAPSTRSQTPTPPSGRRRRVVQSATIGANDDQFSSISSLSDLASCTSACAPTASTSTHPTLVTWLDGVRSPVVRNVGMVLEHLLRSSRGLGPRPGDRGATLIYFASSRWRWAARICSAMKPNVFSQSSSANAIMTLSTASCLGTACHIEHIRTPPRQIHAEVPRNLGR